MSSKKVKAEMNTELPQEMTAMAQKTVDQAQAAFDKASEIAHGNVQLFDAAANAAKNRFNDLQLKAIEFAQANINAGFGFTRKLFAVKEPTEVFSLQQTFLKEQAEVLQKQAAELNELTVALAKEAVKPLQDGLTKSFNDISKSMAA
ncbi:MAG: phasin family protein [Alphaproteobacteria bacterium]|jgi:phasin|nr:phasin family protein [Alphaproteobacteria bacterium]